MEWNSWTVLFTVYSVYDIQQRHSENLKREELQRVKFVFKRASIFGKFVWFWEVLTNE